MLKVKLNTLEQKKENFNTSFVLYPVVAKPPTLNITLIDSFSQFTHAEQIIPGESVTYKYLPQTTNRIVITEGTTFSLKPSVSDTARIVDITNLEDVKFIWTKDGSQLYNENAKRRLQGATSIRIENAKRSISGRYKLELINKYGSTISDEVIIDVIDLNNHPLLYKNLIQNSSGKKGRESWIGDADFKSEHFQRKEFQPYNASLNQYAMTEPQRFKYTNPFYFSRSQSSTKLKGHFEYTKTLTPDTPNADWQRWITKFYQSTLICNEDPNSRYEAYFPAPKYIDRANKNTELSGLEDYLNDNETYFTRDRIKFAIYGGQANCIAYQDIDVSQVSNLIDGEAYGVDRLVAHFFAYIGTGITRYRIKYKSDSNEVIEDNMIPMSYERFYSSSKANDVYYIENNREQVKPKMLPYRGDPSYKQYTEEDMKFIVQNVLPQYDIGGGVFVPRIKMYEWCKNEATGIYHNPGGQWKYMWIDVWEGNGDIRYYMRKMYLDGWWLGFVDGPNSGYTQLGGNTPYWQTWFTRINNPSSIKDPSGKSVRLVQFNEWALTGSNLRVEYDRENEEIKNRVTYKVRKDSEVVIEPITDDETDIKLDFLDENGIILQSKILDGPSAKDVWAVKEKFYVPVYIANTYNWVLDLADQPIKIYNKTYTTYNAVKNASKNKTTLPVDLHASYMKHYIYRLLRADDQHFPDTHMKYDPGAAAMFGYNLDVVVPKKTRTIRVNIIFKHTSNVIYDSNPILKGYKPEEIYYEYLSGEDADKRLIPYTNPRCGVTGMNLSLHVNSVRIDNEHPTFKIPNGNVWYKSLKTLDSDDPNTFNSVYNSGLSGDDNTIPPETENLRYKYDIVADDPIISEPPIEEFTQVEVQTLETGATYERSGASLESLGLLEGPEDPVTVAVELPPVDTPIDLTGNNLIVDDYASDSPSYDGGENDPE